MKKLTEKEFGEIDFYNLEYVDIKDITVEKFEPDDTSSSWMVRKRDPKITVTHCPSGLVVESSVHRSQHRNFRQAIFELNEQLSKRGKELCIRWIHFRDFCK